jgi:hypothetical protein
MRDVTTLGTIDPIMLRRTFPQWRITGTEGCWFAIRGGLEMQTGPRSLLRCVLSASTLVELAEKLSLQEYLDGLTAEELDEVWRRASLPRRPALKVIS